MVLLCPPATGAEGGRLGGLCRSWWEALWNGSNGRLIWNLSRATPPDRFPQDPADAGHRGRIQSGSYQYHLNRGLRQYYELLPGFSDRLASLGSNAIWLDLGAGNAIAARQYLSEPWTPGLGGQQPGNRARVIAFGYERPAPLPEYDDNIPSGRFQAVHGRFFEDINPRDWNRLKGRVDVITSVMGVLSYSSTRDFPAHLGTTLSLLKEGGRLYLETSDFNLAFRGPQGENLPLDEYVRALRSFFGDIQGVRLVGFRSYKSTYVVLERTSGPIGVPPLVPLGFHGDAPPIRIFHYPRPVSSIPSPEL